MTGLNLRMQARATGPVRRGRGRRGFRGGWGFRGGRRDRGFSVIELVLVLAILAVLAGMTAPRYFSALARYRADAAARRIVADLELARSRARAASAPRTIVFDIAGDAYKVTSGDGVDLAGGPYHADLVAVTLTPAPGSGEDRAVTFDGYGKPDRDAAIVLRCGDAVRTIDLEATSGEVVVR